MTTITTIDDLRQIYKNPAGRAVTKQQTRLDKHSRRFIDLAPFLVIASSVPGGKADASPRGETPGFVQVIDDQTLAIPDRPGNNRLDTLENILRNPEVGLIFLLPGVDETLRVNGTAEIRNDDELLDRFIVNGKRPATVLLVHVRELYLHCAKALMRARLWDAETQHAERPIPTLGRMINDQTNSDGPVETQEQMVESYRKILY